jgi:hypothetical protein
MNTPRIIALENVDNPDAQTVHAGDEGQAPPTQDVLIDENGAAIAAAALCFSCDGTPEAPLGAMLKMQFPVDDIPNLYVRLSPLALRQLAGSMLDVAQRIEDFALGQAHDIIALSKGGAA